MDVLKIIERLKYPVLLLPAIVLLILNNYYPLKTFAVLVSFLIFLVFVAAADFMVSRKMRISIETHVSDIEKIAAGNLKIDAEVGGATQKNISRIERTIEQLRERFAKGGYDRNIVENYSPRLIKKYREIALFFITDETGMQIFNNRGNLVSNAEREYFKKAVKTGKTQISNIIISKVTGKLALVLAVPYSKGGVFGGIFGVTIDLQSISSFSEKLQNALLGTVECLKALVMSVQNYAKKTAESAEELSLTSHESAKAIENIAISSSDVATSSEDQLEEMLKASGAMEHIAGNIDAIAGNTGEINRLCEEANKSASSGGREVKVAVQSMANLEESSRKMNEALQEINNSSGKMDEIISTIQAIAEQTNLLALNAAIEAARAGEAGKGFAVVADEVGKLAEMSQSSIKDINSLIKEIQLRVSETNRLVQEDSSIVSDASSKVNNAGVILEEIIKYVNTMGEEVNSITGAITEVSSRSSSVVMSTKIIQEKSRKVSDDIQNVSASTEEQTAAMEEIASTSVTLQNLSKSLREKADSFKL